MNKLREELTRISSIGPQLDPVLEAAFNYLTYCELRQGEELNGPENQRLGELFPHDAGAIEQLKQSIFAKVEAVSSTRYHEPIPLPRLSMSDIPDGGIPSMLDVYAPFVIEGAIAESRAVKEWTLDYMKQRFGSYRCSLSSPTEMSLTGTIGDVLEDVQNKIVPGRYAHNIANIFNENPDLEETLGVVAMAKRLGLTKFFKGCQLFLGGKDLGAKWHCAATSNIFFNIGGRKRWYFANARHTPWIYGSLAWNGLFALSGPLWTVDHTDPVAVERDTPLVARVPRFVTVLEPGDVLVNPPWWWHDVLNLSEFSIAVGTRHYTRSYAGYEAVRACSGYMRGQIGGARLTDAVFHNVHSGASESALEQTAST